MTEDQSTRSPFAGLDKALLRSPTAKTRAAEGIAVSTAEEAKPTRAARKRPAEVHAAAESTETSTISRDRATIEAMQRALKTVGKEIFYARVAPEEKRKVDETVFALKQSGIRTSVNDVGRIALNYLMADHEANGEQSILNQVLASKRA